MALELISSFIPVSALATVVLGNLKLGDNIICYLPDGTTAGDVVQIGCGWILLDFEGFGIQRYFINLQQCFREDGTNNIFHALMTDQARSTTIKRVTCE